MFYRNFNNLSKYSTVHAVDLIGNGMSSRPKFSIVGVRQVRLQPCRVSTRHRPAACVILHSEMSMLCLCLYLRAPGRGVSYRVHRGVAAGDGPAKDDVVGPLLRRLHGGVLCVKVPGVTFGDKASRQTRVTLRVVLLG